LRRRGNILQEKQRPRIAAHGFNDMDGSATMATRAELAGLRQQLTGPGRGITNERVIAAMMRVPRPAFIPPNLREEAYLDGPLPIGCGQTISQPFIVGYMTAAIDPQPGDRVLEVGAGCGYQTAVLAELVQEVFALEIIEGLATRAAATLQHLGYANAHIRHADGWFGWADEAPFDGILVACSPESIPRELVDQLKPGGRMILPIGDRYWGQELVLVKKTNQGITSESVMPVRFVPMTGRAEERPNR
jgi:protein-L-isoaspartate(D-aspartate) O-methyltransferase